MKVFAPGKLVLTGAYAVLEGAPAIVVATSRGAVADGSRAATFVGPEVAFALGAGPAPHVDVSALFAGDRKLGLGASAAALVASLATRAAEEGRDLDDAAVRQELFVRARVAHGAAQGGGSGVDVAASIYGGVVRYVLDDPTPATLPPGLVLTVFACQQSARTSELRALVDSARTHAPAAFRERMAVLIDAARAADAAVAQGDASRFVDAVRTASEGLFALGVLAGAPIVPAELQVLSDAAVSGGGAFCVSGAGGGDVAFYIGAGHAPPAFVASARALGLSPLDLEIDKKGVRIVTTAPSYIGAVTASGPA